MRLIQQTSISYEAEVRIYASLFCPYAYAIVNRNGENDPEWKTQWRFDYRQTKEDAKELGKSWREQNC